MFLPVFALLKRAIAICVPLEVGGLGFILSEYGELLFLLFYEGFWAKKKCLEVFLFRFIKLEYLSNISRIAGEN